MRHAQHGGGPDQRWDFGADRLLMTLAVDRGGMPLRLVGGGAVSNKVVWFSTKS